MSVDLPRQGSCRFKFRPSAASPASSTLWLPKEATERDLGNWRRCEAKEEEKGFPAPLEQSQQ